MSAISKRRKGSRVALAQARESIRHLERVMKRTVAVDEDQADSDSETDERASNRPDSSVEELFDQLLTILEARVNVPQVCPRPVLQSPHCWLIFLTAEYRVSRPPVWPRRNPKLC